MASFIRQALARRVRMSRSTVWKALQGVEEWGVTLFKVNGRGYRLVNTVQWLEADCLHHTWAAADSLRVEIIDTVDSTNTLLLRRALAGELGGLAVAAELQTQGRGRREDPGMRPWVAV